MTTGPEPATSPTAIRARGLSKTFWSRRRRVTSLKEMVVRHYLDPGEKVPHHAVKDLNFDVTPGTSLAVVGSNGSGKSTLLKLVAGITEPTAGTLEVQGRIASMIELGAGFQFELTGMENIFLQGAILGLDREQILGRLDAILDFAELDRFIHTPMKRYSSGMIVRLGFAIALHVDADIVLLDEVLAVGDNYFQVKCLRAIDDLRERGTTVLFVSHSLELVEMVADEVLWLEKGEQRGLGPVDEMLDAIFDLNQENIRRVAAGVVESVKEDLDERRATVLAAAQVGGALARMHAVRFLDAQGQPSRRFDPRTPIVVEVDYETFAPLPDGLCLNISLGAASGQRSAHIEQSGAFDEAARTPGRYRARLEFPTHLLHPGRYVFTVCLTRPLRQEETYDLHLRLYPITLRLPGRRLRHFEETLVRSPGGWG